MGWPKATLPFGPELMLQRVARLVGGVVGLAAHLEGQGEADLGREGGEAQRVPGGLLSVRPAEPCVSRAGAQIGGQQAGGGRPGQGPLPSGEPGVGEHVDAP